MTAEQFVFWLRGYLSGRADLTVEQTQMLRGVLEDVSLQPASVGAPQWYPALPDTAAPSVLPPWTITCADHARADAGREAL